MRRCILPTLCACFLGCSPASDAAELERLRTQVQSLQRDVDALKAAVASLQASEAAHPVGHIPQPVVGVGRKITLSLSTTPADAAIYVDGRLTRERSLERSASHATLRIRVEKTGFRVVEQSVALTRSQSLHYKLMRGRGTMTRGVAR